MRTVSVPNGYIFVEQGGSDIVPTDVAAGLVLVHRSQSHALPTHQYAKIPSYYLQAHPNMAGAGADSGRAVDPSAAAETLERSDVLIDVTDATNAGENAENVTVSGGTRSDTGGAKSGETDHAGAREGCPGDSLDNSGCDYTRINVDIPASAQSGVEISIPYWMTVHNAAYYMKYAVATYSWPIYVYMNLCCGVCQLWHGCRYARNNTQHTCTCTSYMFLYIHVQVHAPLILKSASNIGVKPTEISAFCVHVMQQLLCSATR